MLVKCEEPRLGLRLFCSLYFYYSGVKGINCHLDVVGVEGVRAEWGLTGFSLVGIVCKTQGLSPFFFSTDERSKAEALGTRSKGKSKSKKQIPYGDDNKKGNSNKKGNRKKGRCERSENASVV